MAASFTVSSDYGYVLATVTASFAVTFWHGMRIGSFRKAAKIPYPIHYALNTGTTDPAQKKAEYLFNCAQRAHGNYLENYAIFVPAILIAGLKNPLVASGMGAVWLVSRVIYATGYTRSDKEKGSGRLYGSGYYLAQIGLLVMSGMTSWSLVKA